MPIRWRAMVGADLDAVLDIADRLHPDNPESRQALASRLDLFPAGCRILDDGQRVIGYGFSHPALHGHPPPLDAVLGPLPGVPDCLHVHDVAVLAEARGSGASGRYLAEMRTLATTMGLDRLCLVAVGGTADYWVRHGFKPVEAAPGLAAILATYGGGGTYMTLGAR